MKFFFGLILSSIFLFIIDGPSDHENLIYHALWNLGHPILFAILTLYILEYHFKHHSLPVKAFLVLLLSLTLGLIIELVQEKLNRTFDWQDIFNNILGSCLLLMWVSLKDKKRTSLLHGSTLVVGIILLSFILFPLYQAIKIHYNIHQNFPVLSTFNNELEIKKWHGDNITLVRNDKTIAGYTLQATMTPSNKYNPITLKHFSKNWQLFTRLEVTVGLEKQKEIELCVRITDIAHDLGEQRYDDRYQQCFNVNSKKHILNIPLENIIHAPLTRQLDINKISEITIFSKNLLEERLIYIYRVELLQ